MGILGKLDILSIFFFLLIPKFPTCVGMGIWKHFKLIVLIFIQFVQFVHWRYYFRFVVIMASLIYKICYPTFPTRLRHLTDLSDICQIIISGFLSAYHSDLTRSNYPFFVILIVFLYAPFGCLTVD